MKVLRSIPARIRYGAIAAITAAFIIGAGLAVELNSNPSLFVAESPQPSASATPSPKPSSIFRKTPSPATPLKASISAAASPSPSISVSLSPKPAIVAKVETPAPVKVLFGHLPYAEADPSRLKGVGAFARDGFARPESLDLEAAAAFQQMVVAAKKEKILLMPISGFWSIAEQRELFEQQIQRKGGIEAAARWSAPPGHSEHHTGYAIDVTDAQSPDNDLKLTFQATRAYSWMATNAYQFGFEQSFPEHNRQGVSFEPWHWRYVNSPRAAQIFTIARTQFPSTEVN